MPVSWGDGKIAGITPKDLEANEGALLREAVEENPRKLIQYCVAFGLNGATLGSIWAFRPILDRLREKANTEDDPVAAAVLAWRNKANALQAEGMDICAMPNEPSGRDLRIVQERVCELIPEAKSAGYDREKGKMDFILKDKVHYTIDYGRGRCVETLVDLLPKMVLDEMERI